MKTTFRHAVLVVAVCATNALWAPRAAAQADQNADRQGDPEHGRQLVYTCLGCHGIEGYRNAYPSYRVPKLGGQKPAYLEAALRAYRSAARAHPTMRAQGGSLSDGDIDDVVAWITSSGSAADELDAGTPGLPEAAKTCVSCHGTSGKAVSPAPPVLSGQHPSYLRQALEQYKSMKRGNSVMNSFAAGLTPADMERVAQFYGSRDGLHTLEQGE